MKRVVVIASIFVLGCLALAPYGLCLDLSLPSVLTRVDDEAFEGCALISSATIPDSVTQIGSRAFADCSEMTSIYIPGGVNRIEPDAFDGCASDLLIVTDADTSARSAAHQYALDHTLDYQAGTVYRALTVGQNYEHTSGWPTLEAPFRDAAAVAAALTQFEGTPYAGHITELYDITAEEILSAIRSAFAGATEADVSLFFYSGHGCDPTAAGVGGALVGTDGETITAAKLRRALDAVPGRKIVVIDACFSGNLITGRAAGDEDEATQAATPDSFAGAFVDAFSLTSRDGLAGGDYFVLTAASATQTSHEPRGGHGYFTYYFLRGAGCDPRTGAWIGSQADANGNGVVTVNEQYRYIYEGLRTDEVLDYYDITQTCQCWPSDCDWFGFLRM